jgi:hypothetical protein
MMKVSSAADGYPVNERGAETPLKAIWYTFSTEGLN